MSSDQTPEHQNLEKELLPPEHQNLEKELLPFLKLEAKIDVKMVALRYFLDMTGSKEGRDFITKGDKFLPAILALTNDEQKDITKEAYLAVVNLTTEETIAKKIMNWNSTFVCDILKKMLKSDFMFADEASSVVSNITRVPECARKLSEQILEDGSEVPMESIVNTLCIIDFNKTAKLDYLGPIIANLTQTSGIRKVVLDKERCIVQKLLPFTDYKDSLIRRRGIIGTLKNCCFEFDHHQWLLSEEVDILSRLLLPLAGGEEFDEDDIDKLPLDLQYLPPDKEREADPDLRAMLIEALTLLCSTKHGRLLIKAANAYIILRELHRWEMDPKAKLACLKLIELLISDEPAEGMEELHCVEVPEDLETKFNKMDVDLLKDLELEQQAEQDGCKDQ